MAPHEIKPSIGQRLLWFLDRYRGDNGSLNCPLLCRIRGGLDVDGLQAALGTVVARHESLRTVFTGGGRGLMLQIRAPQPVPVHVVDLTADPEPEAAMREAVAVELRTRIDPARDPVRVTLWRLAPQDHVLCVNLHHLVTDSWSLGVVFEDLCALLDQGAGGTAPLPPLGWQYRDFAEAQERELTGEPKRRLDDYWRGQLAGMKLPALPLQPEKPGRTGRNTALVRGDLGPEVTGRLKELARNERTTAFCVLLTVYYAVLHRTTGDADLAVASLFANRSRPEVRRTVGFCANMVILRRELAPAETFVRQVRATHATIVGAFLHQALPYQMLPLAPGSNGQRADDVVFQMLADPIYSTTAGGAQLEVLVPDGVGSRFEFELVLVPVGDGFRALLFYDADRLEASFADDFMDRYIAAAGKVASNPATPLAEV